MSIEPGALCYYLDPQRSWTLGEVAAWDGKKGACKAKDGQGSAAKLTADQIFIAREDCVDEDVNDLLHLTLLHDSTILACLRTRYMKDVIYTNIGAIVIAINPFNFKIPWYMDTEMPKYLAEGDRIERNIPHSWAQAHNTYWEMMNEKGNQTILVSGESGAGKTEASKIVFKYLAAVSSLHGTDAQKEAGGSVGTKINMTSPILESFGNAKTVRNDNSSRFGKFMRVKFSSDGFLVGAHITKYLLEKSRVVAAMPGERCYHSFYLLCRSGKRGEWGVGADKDFRSIRSGNTLSNKDFDTPEEMDEVLSAMGTVGIAPDRVDSVWRVVAGIMHALNVEFEQDDEGSKFAPAAAGHIAKAVSCFEVGKDSVMKELVTTEMEVMGQVITKVLKPVQATDGRDALCKTLYDEQFGWLIEACNALLDVPTADGNWIGLLDIFGFEDFEVNSFEQLCINLANEALQGHYNHHIFTKDMDECRSEGIDVTSVEFPDNAPCLNMIMGKGGVLALLDEQCLMGSGTDMGFLGAIVDKHKKNPFFEKKALAKTSFLVHHYAGDVSYEVQGFLDKNRDTLKDAWKLLFRASSNPHVAGLLPEPVDKSGPRITVGGYFKSQLGDLMELINSTNPHWIRCVKPHPAKKPLMMCGVQTMKQLASAGVLGTVKIRKAGFPVRVKFEDFSARYRVIAPGQHGDPRAASQAIVDASDVPAAQCQLGKTRVFMKTDAYIHLEQLKKERLSRSAVIAQAWAAAAAAARSMQQAVNKQHAGLIEEIRVSVRKNRALMRDECSGRARICDEWAEGMGAAAEKYAAAEDILWGELRRQAEVKARQDIADLVAAEEQERARFDADVQANIAALYERLRWEEAQDRKRREMEALRREQKRQEQELQRKQAAAARARASALQREVAAAAREKEEAERKEREAAAERERQQLARIEQLQDRQRAAAERRAQFDAEQVRKQRSAAHEAVEKQRWAEYVAARQDLDRAWKIQESKLKSGVRVEGGKARTGAVDQQKVLLAERKLADERLREELRAQQKEKRDAAIREALRVQRLEKEERLRRASETERMRSALHAADGRKQARQRMDWERMAEREQRRQGDTIFRRQMEVLKDQQSKQKEQAMLERAMALQAMEDRRAAAASSRRRHPSPGPGARRPIPPEMHSRLKESIAKCGSALQGEMIKALEGQQDARPSGTDRGRGRSAGSTGTARSPSAPARHRSPGAGSRRAPPPEISPDLHSRLMGSEATAAAGVLNDKKCREGIDSVPIGVERPRTRLQWVP